METRRRAGKSKRSAQRAEGERRPIAGAKRRRAGQGWAIAALIQVSIPGRAIAEEPVVEKLEHGEINWSDRTVIATGSGAPNLKLQSVAAVRLNAERGAKVDAYRSVIETLKGIKITEKETGASALGTPQVQAQVQGIVRGCKTVDTRYYSDGAVDVVIRCPLDGGLATTLAPVMDRKEVSTSGAEKYSGLVVDAVGTGAKPALQPRVVAASGKEIYAANMVEPNTLRSSGVAAYVRSVEEAKQHARAGKSPLVVKATGLIAGSSELSVSDEDAALLQGANLKFLAEAKVVIATDAP